MLYTNYITILKGEEKTKAAEHSKHGGESHSVAHRVIFHEKGEITQRTVTRAVVPSFQP